MSKLRLSQPSLAGSWAELGNNPHQHTLIYLKGITWSNLQAIIQFIYLGQTEVERESFEAFMNDAKELEVKGLGDIHETKLLSNIATDVEPDKIILDSSYFEDTILPDVFPTVQVTVEDDSYQQTSALAIKKDKDQKYPCTQCEYFSTTSSNLQIHIMAKHEGITFECDIVDCDQFSMKTNLTRHKKNKHEL